MFCLDVIFLFHNISNPNIIIRLLMTNNLLNVINHDNSDSLITIIKDYTSVLNFAYIIFTMSTRS
jgi:hypothetical protein